jgi:hypothetical protein
LGPNVPRVGGGFGPIVAVDGAGSDRWAVRLRGRFGPIEVCGGARGGMVGEECRVERMSE